MNQEAMELRIGIAVNIQNQGVFTEIA